jgi:PilZ domain
MESDDKRRFPRFAGRFKVKYFLDDKLVEAETEDLSVSGAYIVATRIPLTQRVLTLKLFPEYSQQAVTIEARVTRAKDAGFGVEWVQAVVPLNPNPLRTFLHDVLGITRGFVKKMDDTNGVPRFVYRFSYDFLTKSLQRSARTQVAEESAALGQGSSGGPSDSSPVPGAIPIAYQKAASKTKERARMIGGFDNGLVMQTKVDLVENFDRLDISVYPDDRKKRIELKGLVSRVKPLEKDCKVYVRLTLDNDQKSLGRYRVLAEALRDK